MRRDTEAMCHRQGLERKRVEEGDKVSRFGVFWLPRLTTAASSSCKLKSAAAIDAEDVPVAHHAIQSPRLRSAKTEGRGARSHGV